MISFKPKQIELENLYSKLIAQTEEYRLSEKNRDKSYVLFGAIAGHNYNKNGLMVIGRSPNGWHRYNLSTTGLFEGINRLFDYPEKLTELRNNNNTSKLWQVLNRIGTAIYEKDWEQSILYSNYCKLAPDEESEPNGTPPKRLRNLQQDICDKILRLELDVYCPKHIIVFTGCNIVDMDFSERLMPFLLTYFSDKDFSDKPWPRPIKKMTWGNGRFAIEVYKINETYVYLSEHPDRKNTNEHANVLIKNLPTFI